jgi:hypothetical protein
MESEALRRFGKPRHARAQFHDGGTVGVIQDACNALVGKESGRCGALVSAGIKVVHGCLAHEKRLRLQYRQQVDRARTGQEKQEQLAPGLQRRRFGCAGAAHDGVWNAAPRELVFDARACRALVEPAQQHRDLSR